MYQEIRLQGVLIGIKRHDGLQIPLTETNSDYREYLAWLKAGNTVEPDPSYSVEGIRAQKWEAIKEQRDSRKAAGVFVNGYWYHSDADSRIQWLGTKDSARDVLAAGGDMSTQVPINGQPLRWKTMSGEYVMVTVQTAFDVVEATKGLDAILFYQAEVKKAALYQSPTPETFDTAAGWNKTYAESVA